MAEALGKVKGRMHSRQTKFPKNIKAWDGARRMPDKGLHPMRRADGQPAPATQTKS